MLLLTCKQNSFRLQILPRIWYNIGLLLITLGYLYWNITDKLLLPSILIFNLESIALGHIYTLKLKSIIVGVRNGIVNYYHHIIKVLYILKCSITTESSICCSIIRKTFLHISWKKIEPIMGTLKKTVWFTIVITFVNQIFVTFVIDEIYKYD